MPCWLWFSSTLVLERRRIILVMSFRWLSIRFHLYDYTKCWVLLYVSFEWISVRVYLYPLSSSRLYL